MVLGGLWSHVGRGIRVVRNDRENKIGLPSGIALVGAFATIAGIGEIVVGSTGNYSGILAHSIPPATSTIIIGAFYSLGGLSIFTMRKLGAALGIFFIACEVLGRLYLVMIGIAPSTGGDANQDRHWRLDYARRYRLRGVAVEKVRLDRASGGEWRVEVAIVHELVEFGTIPGNAQTF